MTARRAKRVLLIGDLHCGHHLGLTPPDWWYPPGSSNPRIAKIARFQRELWRFAVDAVKDLRPIDILEVGGDAIDGKGERSGGVELVTSDRVEQCEMAAAFVNLVGAPQVRLVYGTRYHVGRDEDFEQVLVDRISAPAGNVKIQGHGFYNVNGCIIDSKHKVGSSSVPHGRMTSLARARLWNQVWSLEHERQPAANIIVRHHVHYFNFCGGRDWVAMTVPALCYGTSFGIRECDGTVDIGMIVLDIDANGGWSWRPILAKFNAMKAHVESL